MTQLTQEDLQGIRKVVDQSFVENFKSVWEHNLEPAFEETATTKDLQALKEELKRDNRDTRDYLAGKLFELRGDVIGPAKRLDTKIMMLIQKLEAKGVLQKDDVREISEVPLFEQV